MKDIRWALILRLFGIVLLSQALFMALCIPFSVYYQDEGYKSLLTSLLICGISGALLVLCVYFRKNKNETQLRHIKKKEAYWAVLGLWIFLTFSGTLPYYLYGYIPDFSAAYFESVSGYTTTGASILSDIEIFPPSILMWRSMTHWVGGLGILLIVIAIIPFLGIGGASMLSVETTLTTQNKLHPRIAETAKRLWGVYFFLTAILIALLMCGDMNFYESVNHAFSAVAGGGFSVKNTSISEYSPYCHYVLSVFMFLSATNFTLIYYALRGRFSKLRNEELKVYFLVTAVATLICCVSLYANKINNYSVEEIFRHSLFQVTSILSTTGTYTSDYMQWTGSCQFLMVLLMFIGGMSCSTTGGIKIFRYILLFKNAKMQIRQFSHPNAVLPIRFNGVSIPKSTITNVLAVYFIYMGTFILGAFLFIADGIPFLESISGSASCLDNAGPGLGFIGPVGNYGTFSPFAKNVCSFLMLAGRLELITIYVLFVSIFWRNK